MTSRERVLLCPMTLVILGLKCSIETSKGASSKGKPSNCSGLVKHDRKTSRFPTLKRTAKPLISGGDARNITLQLGGRSGREGGDATRSTERAVLGALCHTPMNAGKEKGNEERRIPGEKRQLKKSYGYPIPVLGSVTQQIRRSHETMREPSSQFCSVPSMKTVCGTCDRGRIEDDVAAAGGGAMSSASCHLLHRNVCPSETFCPPSVKRGLVT